MQLDFLLILLVTIKNSTASLELIKHNYSLTILPFLSIYHLVEDSNFAFVRI